MQRQINQGKVHSHIYVVSPICTVSVEKKKKKEKRQEKQGKKQFIIFSSTRATPNHC